MPPLQREAVGACDGIWAQEPQGRAVSAVSVSRDGLRGGNPLKQFVISERDW